jgi:lysozyme
VTPNNPHTIGPQGLGIIRHYEKLRLTPYLCPANKLTIGWGHVLLPKFDAKWVGTTPENLARIIAECERERLLTKEAKQLRISPATADNLLERDTSQTALFLRSVTPVALNQNQFDALVSFIFNIGQGAYAESTLRKKLRAGNYDGAAAELLRWVYGTVDKKKVVLPGLVARRKAERALFLTRASA